MGLGTTTTTTQGARAANAPQSTAWGPSAAQRSNRIPDDDRAVAVIQNPHRAENFGTGQGAIYGSPAATFRERMEQFTASFHASFTMYKGLSDKVAGGRFSPKALREQIEASAKAGDYLDTATEHTSSLAFLRSDSNSASRGHTDTRAMSWLRDQAQQALSSQKNIEPGRVLVLLRDMIRPSSDEK